MRVAKTWPEFRRDGVGGQEGSRKAPRRGDRQWEAGGKAALSAVSAQREVQQEATSRKQDHRQTARLGGSQSHSGTRAAACRLRHGLCSEDVQMRHKRGIRSLNRYSLSSVSCEAVAILKQYRSTQFAGCRSGLSTAHPLRLDSLLHTSDEDSRRRLPRGTHLNTRGCPRRLRDRADSGGALKGCAPEGNEMDRVTAEAGRSNSSCSSPLPRVPQPPLGAASHTASPSSLHRPALLPPGLLS